MRLHRAARLSDAKSGRGWYVSFITGSGFVLVALRPRYWRFATIRLQSRPGVTRHYFGPLEVETWRRPEVKA